ncbi:Sulfotransferase [Rhynchospora pubera]|uniref:Sulfotransferase n=1 Tax=Rhynchospora pubera TaxID=906938 RepID=A0AAV8DEQ2_9POAL|nr:Sulfotransferase [Rhynchospora pubera]
MEAKVDSKLRPRLPITAVPQIEEMDSKYKELILTLPKDEEKVKYRKYQDFWYSERHLPGILAMQEVFKPRPNDVILASFPKSGTTWLKALTFTIMHRDKYSFSDHPLVELNPHDCVPFIENHYASRDEHYLETLPSPRVLATHLAYSTLPESIVTSTCPIVYICREPKDVLVSFWHMLTKYEWLKEPSSFAQTFESFCEGRVHGGPVWEHVLEYYTKSLCNPEKILILKYEQMLECPIDGVMRLANFIGCPFSVDELKNGLVEKIIEFCSFDKLKDLDVNKNEIGNLENSYFFRKATVGDWKNYMTPVMANKLDKITEEKLRGFSFTF